MNKIIKRISGALLALIIAISSMPLNALAITQVNNEGGVTKREEDNIEVSKKIVSSNRENYFDIELKVQTGLDVSTIEIDKDVAIVLVLDTSNSMNYCMTTMSTCSVDANKRITRAKAAIKDFAQSIVDDYGTRTDMTINIGVVTFDNSARIDVSNRRLTSSSLSGFKTAVNNINRSGGTNLEDGLRKANTMLGDNLNKNIDNKYVIVLTDGYPTMYGNGSGSYSGRGCNVVTNSNATSAVCNESTDIPNGYTRWYTETAAANAKTQASYLRAKANVFVVSVGLEYQPSPMQHSNAWTIETGSYNNSTRKYSTTYTHFENWLTRDISGATNAAGEAVQSYYKVTDTNTLSSIYSSIFAKIKQDVDILSEAWIAKDEMNKVEDGIKISDYIEFVGFKQNTGYTYVDSLEKGKNGQVNTAKLESGNIINWDLINSRPVQLGNKYVYTLQYRVRLKNEQAGFIENNDYFTNGTAKLSYVLVTDGEISKHDTIEFARPSVYGYLGEVDVTKESSYDADVKLPNATFKLTHASDCECLTERAHMASTFSKTYTSNANGILHINNIPSGHKYTLVETAAPTNYILPQNPTVYHVTVAYDVVTTDISNFKITNAPMMGNLIVKKEITNDNKIDTSKEFTFTVSGNFVKGTITAIKTDSDNKTSNETLTVNENGEITFTLKHNESMNLPLPAGYTYTVVETDTNEYDITYDSNKTGTISATNAKTTVVKNKIKDLVIKAKKTWKGTQGFTYIPAVKFQLQHKVCNDAGKCEYVNIENSEKVLNKESSWKCSWTVPGDDEYNVVEVGPANVKDSEVFSFFKSKVVHEDGSLEWEIVNINTQTAVLPATGSAGMLIVILMGGLLILFSLVYGLINFKSLGGLLNNK